MAVRVRALRPSCSNRLSKARRRLHRINPISAVLRDAPTAQARESAEHSATPPEARGFRPTRNGPGSDQDATHRVGASRQDAPHGQHVQGPHARFGYLAGLRGQGSRVPHSASTCASLSATGRWCEAMATSS